MIKIGVRGHDVIKSDPKTLSNKINELGFEGVQFVQAKALSEPLNFDDLTSFKKDFNTPIFMLGAYFNPVHPDKEALDKGINNFKRHLKIANEIGAPWVGTESGSLMGSPWGYMPENHTDKTFNQLLPIFEDLLKVAKENNTKIIIEGAWNHVLYDPKRVLKFVNHFNSDDLVVTVDLYNFLNINNYKNQNEIFLEAITLLKDKIKVFHLKDYIIKDNKLVQVGLGQGLIDYPYVINLIKKHNPDAYLIFEGVKYEDMESSLKYIKSLI